MTSAGLHPVAEGHRRLLTNLAGVWTAVGLVIIAFALFAGLQNQRATTAENDERWRDHYGKLWSIATDEMEHAAAPNERRKLVARFRKFAGLPAVATWDDGAMEGRALDVEIVRTLALRQESEGAAMEDRGRTWQLINLTPKSGVEVAIARGITKTPASLGGLQTAVWIPILVSLGVIALGIRITKACLHPLGILIASARRAIDEERFVEPIEGTDADAFAELRVVINELMHEIEQDRARIENVRDSLDQQVTERTAEFVLANERLHTQMQVRERMEKRQLDVAQELSQKNQELNTARVDAERAREDAVRTAQSLRDSEERFELAVAGSNDGIWDWDLATDQIYFSPRFHELLGLNPTARQDTPEDWFRLVSSAELSHFQSELSDHIAGRSHHLQCEFRIERTDGRVLWVLCRGAAVRNGSGEAVRLAGSLSDISATKEAEEALRFSAQHDKLTGLPNRSLFNEGLSESMRKAEADSSHRLAVLFFDFDRFKVINDSLGHKAGDQLLISISDRLRVHTRESDMLARLGGDEFVVLLDGIEDEREAIYAGERMLNIFAEPHDLGGIEVTSTASIGIVVNDSRYHTPDEMIRDADIAMYEAKSTGKARCVTFDAAMHAKAVDRMTLEQDLRYAIEREQLHLVYQPIVWLETGAPAGFEALVRWHHHDRGTIGPDRFIQIAEETGLIVPMGEWILRRACLQIREWRQQFPHFRLTMNVNISKRQVLMPDIVDRVRTIIKECGIEPSMIKLEVTESAIMDDRGTDVTRTLEALRAVGTPLAMDDFGTGQSSLSCLHKFPIDVLKIDRSFVRDMEQRRSLSAVTQAVVSLAHNLGMKVVAEGIEGPGQLTQLQALECDLAQGFFFARPLAAEEATKFLSNPQPMGAAA